LDLIVVEHLYDKYGQGLDEGTLTLLKQAGVSNKSLGLIAVKFKLH
jgi:dsRNA-specific ribonuclease